LKTEAAIVGGGPTGLTAAREIARYGYEVTVFEEHPTIGEPNHCAGILSVEGLERLGVKPSTDFIQHQIKGGTVFAPNGTALRIKGSRTRAYIVDRAAFDRHLAEAAHDHGAVIKTGSRVKQLLTSEGNVQGVLTHEETPSDIVIDCEGLRGRLADSMTFPKPKGILSGINVEVSNVQVEQGMVEVWFGSRLAPGFFAWVAPTGENSARCGLGCRGGDPWLRLNSFLKDRFGECTVKGPERWPIITGGPIDKTHCSGMLLVGDVVGQVKPTTAGGVIMGGLCALEAAVIAVQALEEGDSSRRVLARYDENWRRKLGKEFSTMLHARRIADKISDGRMDRLFSASRKAGLEETAMALIEDGDMDMQSGIIRKALTNPSVLKVGASVLGRTLFSELKVLLDI